MYVSRIITIDHKVDTKEEVDAFDEYIEGLVLTINHTPYTVEVVEALNQGELS